MPKFSKKSEELLKYLDPRLAGVLREAIKSYDFAVIETYRSKERQNQLLLEGKTKLAWPKSKHNTKDNKPAMVKAVDIVPYPIDWSMKPENVVRYYYLAGVVMACAKSAGLNLRWGGNWDQDMDFKDQTFNDLPHFEIV